MSSVLDAAIGDPTYTDSLPYSIPDALDAAKMAPFNPDSSQPWWQSIVQYGATRAIDNRYGPVNVSGNAQAGSFQGAGGKTVLANGSSGTVAGAGLLSGNTGLILLAVVGLAVVYLAVKG
jgi:hypothetical protein